MANLRPLTITSAGEKQEQLDADNLIVGAGVTTISGNLLISAAGANITIDTGKTFGTTGTGNINLPNNGSARFQIEGTGVGSTVTAPNLDQLTDGSLTSLHAHSEVPTLVVSKTAAASIGANQIVYITNAGEINLAQANSISTSRSTLGVAPSAISMSSSGDVMMIGEVSIEFDGSLTLDEDDPVYLSATTAGRATNLAPSASGEVVKLMGIVTDASAYGGTPGDTATVLVGLLGTLPESIP